MTVAAIHLDWPIRTSQIWPEMRKVAQLDLSRIARARTQRGQFGMMIVEVLDLMNVLHVSRFRFQIGVALRASWVGGVRKAKRTFVFEMARTAARRERRLHGMMRRRVVASEAGFISDFVAEDPGLRDVADSAALAETGVRYGKRTGAVDFLSSSALGEEPSEGDDGNCDGKPEPPATESMRTREVLQVDPLGQGFGCAYASHVRSG